MSSGAILLSLIAAVLKAGVLLGLAAGLAWVLKAAPARARHGLWAGALVGCLVLPVLSPWVPHWSIAALPVPELAAARAAATPAAVEVVPESHRATGSGPRLPAAGRAVAAAAELPGQAAGSAPTDRGAGQALLARVSPAGWLVGLWLLGCAIGLVRLLRALWAARRLERGAVSAEGTWARQLSEARRRVGLKRPVRLLLSQQVATPMTWGVLQPVVLLPARAAGWSGERRRIVLLHELVHVRRADWLVRLMGRIACSVYWPNPLAWAAARRLVAEQETACDEEVVALGTRPSSYAGHLLAIARSAGPALAAPAHALDMARRSQMEGRLMSILDGGRRLRGGRKLAVLALLLLAGLVPALAAIEPWTEERESPAPAGGEAPEAVPSAETEGVARILGELQALGRQMEPYESELEGLEAEMEPIERELAGLETEMGPVEAELEGFEAELEPFTSRLKSLETELEPYEVRLEAIASEIEPFEGQLKSLESEMRPFEEVLEAIEVEMRPFEERLAGLEVELEPLAEEIERVAGRLGPLAEADGASADLERLDALVRQLNERMAPLHEAIGDVHEEMRPLRDRMSAAHREMEPLHERMSAIHEEMRPVFERTAAVHQEMEPLHERMAAIHEEMEPVHERMGQVHERMRPHHEQMGEQHERMEPFHREMGEIHERMQPLHEEMGRRHEELRRELVGVVERMLARELADVTAADTDYGVAAKRVVDAVSMRVDDGTLSLMTSAPELRGILSDAMAAHATASEPELAAAIERVVRGLGELQIEAR